MTHFRPFAAAVAAHFAIMSQGELYRVDLDGDAVWQAYLATFPEGTNPLYRVRTEHDGSYDRNFVRKLGNVVRINADGSLTTLWDAPHDVHPYNVVCQILGDIVRSAAVNGLFRIKETSLGYMSTVEALGEGNTHRWYHFHAAVAAKHHTRDVDTICGNANTTVQVMRRGFEEILPSAVETVLDLMQAGNLYRGAEFQAALVAFQKAQQHFLSQPEAARTIVLWSNCSTSVARLRNTVIGTLLQDLSDGKDLEFAVKAYEQKVAPTNYKRPTALITKGMIEQATKTIRELGLESALERRFAVFPDVSVNDVLWVDGQVQPLMKDGLTGLLMGEVKPTPPSWDKTEKVSIDDFMQNVLPKAVGLELFFAGNLQSNLMSITAPVHADAGNLFKWDNSFGWSYNGNITDSIKEKVKAAGGNIDAKLRVSLAWFNHDDLDLHAHSPEGHIYYGQKAGSTRYYSNNLQILDVDMNVSPTTRKPVENLSWVKPADGHYRIGVNSYTKRETQDVGFVLEIENDGIVTQYSYQKAVQAHSTVRAIEFDIKNQKVVDLKVIDSTITGQGIVQEKWGLKTEGFVKVNTLLNSPNHWNGRAIGNKHWFFILDQCQNDEPTRGIYNEFLKPELETHRKVFEVLGNKTKVQPSADQLSGLGFSSTKRDSVLVRVTGQSLNKIYQINF